MPLTYAGEVDAEHESSEKQAHARKIKPQYARGRPAPRGHGRQQPEAEFIQMLLLEEGIPSTLRRSAGFDVPDMLAAGPRDVLVPESGVEAARDVLLQSDIEVTHAPHIAREVAAVPRPECCWPALLAGGRRRRAADLARWRRRSAKGRATRARPGVGAGPTASRPRHSKSRRSPDDVVTSERWSFSLYCVQSATSGVLIAAKLCWISRAWHSSRARLAVVRRPAGRARGSGWARAG